MALKCRAYFALVVTLFVSSNFIVFLFIHQLPREQRVPHNVPPQYPETNKQLEPILVEAPCNYCNYQWSTWNPGFSQDPLRNCYRVPEQEDDFYDWEDFRYYRDHLKGSNEHGGTTGVPMTIHFFWETGNNKVVPIQILRLPIMSSMLLMPKRYLLCSLSF